MRKLNCPFILGPLCSEVSRVSPPCHRSSPCQLIPWVFPRLLTLQQRCQLMATFLRKACLCPLGLPAPVGCLWLLGSFVLPNLSVGPSSSSPSLTEIRSSHPDPCGLIWSSMSHRHLKCIMPKIEFLIFPKTMASLTPVSRNGTITCSVPKLGALLSLCLCASSHPANKF